MLSMPGPGVIRAGDRGEIRTTRSGKRIIIPTGQLRRILTDDEELAEAGRAAAA